MPVNTLSAAAHITPTVIKTFIEHSNRKRKKFQQGQLEELSTDDILYDEYGDTSYRCIIIVAYIAVVDGAFHIVKSFILLGTKNTVESLQSFTNTHVPSPYWAAVSPVQIPLVTTNCSADILINWFGTEELQRVVGGERWWQVRGLDGIDAEWITEREYLRPTSVKKDAKITPKISNSDKDILRMEHLETVMLYIHGGGYFWGSINTHQYQIIRYARKIKGRAFAVNYRKAPQYPWPCPLQDVLAAYLYLIDPPADALHKAVSPSKIVLAGDSAGGGLSITVLTILRDMGLPLTAGAILISPWVDLTHSFPSIMTNTQTDIIPPHGFLSRPSTLWPVDPIKDGGRVIPVIPQPKASHTDTTIERPYERNISDKIADEKHTQPHVKSLPVLAGDDTISCARGADKVEDANIANSHMNGQAMDVSAAGKVPDIDDLDFWQPKPSKVLMDNPRDIPLEMCSQMHMYAATEQLLHPLVSPILQGSLGNLCPLYIIAGDGEVLRDEVIYLAHRAAHPTEFPARAGVLRDNPRQMQNAENFQRPTKVHLQVYDGMCHVLTVFTFTKSAKYAYRSVRHVTNNSEEHLERNPFPELHRPSSGLLADEEPDHDERGDAETMAGNAENSLLAEMRSRRSDIKMYKKNESKVKEEAKTGQADKIAGTPGAVEELLGDVETQKDIPNVVMIRERVDIHGKVRPMEPKGEVTALRVRPEEVGIIKEAPLNKWWSGQKEWDQRYRRKAEKVVKQRRSNQTKAKKIMAAARDQGLLLEHEMPPLSQLHRLASDTMSAPSTREIGKIQNDRRWGPLGLDNENVPPSAIANRRDTPEALALLKKTIYNTAPVTHQTVPKMKTSDIIRAMLDPNDDQNQHPQQSVSEQQVRKHIFPSLHGLQMWDSLLRLFMRQRSKKKKGKQRAAAAQITSEQKRSSLP